MTKSVYLDSDEEGRVWVYKVQESGWSSGTLTLWICASLREAERLKNLSPERRFIEPQEVEV